MLFGKNFSSYFVKFGNFDYFFKIIATFSFANEKRNSYIFRNIICATFPTEWGESLFPKFSSLNNPTCTNN